jgi:hypothetical protein
MNKFNPVENFWASFFREAEGEGSGAGGDNSGVAAGEDKGEGEAAAADPSPPATTFLTEAGKAEEVPAEDAEKTEAAEPPAPFDLAALTLPEGLELPEELGKTFAEVLDDRNLSSQERGQKLIDMYSENLKTVSEQMTQANMDLWTKTNDGWREQIKELPEFKANPDAEAGKVLQALTSIGAGEDFFKALDLTGAGNHPSILQVLHRLAKPYMEGGVVQGQGGAKPSRQLGANIYTSANKGD